MPLNYNVAHMSGFGTWLRSHRKALRLYQSDVAKRADVSPSYISTLEREQPHTLTGDVIRPDRDKVIAIAKAVKGDVDEALRLCGYAPVEPDEFHNILDGVVLMFQHGADLTPEQKVKLMEVVKLVAQGVLNDPTE